MATLMRVAQPTGSETFSGFKGRCWSGTGSDPSARRPCRRPDDNPEPDGENGEGGRRCAATQSNSGRPARTLAWKRSPRGAGRRRGWSRSGRSARSSGRREFEAGEMPDMRITSLHLGGDHLGEDLAHAGEGRSAV